MDDNVSDYINGLQSDLSEQRSKNAQLQQGIAASSFESKESNLIEFQLDTAEMLGKIEHFLRGDYITIDKEGNEVWSKQKDATLRLFNDYGVNSLMTEISKYLDKNTILSTYDDLRVNEIMADLGDALTDFIYCNYERMGMDTEFKKSRYPLTVITILHMIESAYRRALRGQTREDLNASKIFMQSDNLSGHGPSLSPTKKRFNLLRPSTW